MYLNIRDTGWSLNCKWPFTSINEFDRMAYSCCPTPLDGHVINVRLQYCWQLVLTSLRKMKIYNFCALIQKDVNETIFLFRDGPVIIHRSTKLSIVLYLDILSTLKTTYFITINPDISHEQNKIILFSAFLICFPHWFSWCDSIF